MSKLESRIKKLEKASAPKEIDQPKFYRLENGKYIVFPAGMEGLRLVLDFILTDSHTESPLTLEQIREQYPNIIDDTERINELRAKPFFT